MTFKFNCPKCQKSIKVSSELAGKVAKCPGCESKLRIPTPQPAAAGAARVKSSSSKPGPAADTGALPFDDDEWEQELNPFQAPEAEDEKSNIPSYAEPKKVTTKSLRWTKRGLKLMNFGLSGMGLCWILSWLLRLVGVIGGDAGSPTIAMVIVGFMCFFMALIWIGPYFCITVPEKTGAKQMAIVSAVAQTIAIFAGIAMFVSIGRGAAAGSIDPTETAAFFMLILIATLTSYFSFVNFMKQLATFIGDTETAGSAQTVIMIGVVEALCIVIAFILPFMAKSMTDLAWLGTIAALCYVTAWIGGFIACWMYIGAIQKLSVSMPGR